MKSITDSVLFIVLNPTEVDYLSSQSLEELQRLRHPHPQILAERNLKMQVCCNLLVHTHHSKHIKQCLTFLTLFRVGASMCSSIVRDYNSF